MRPRLLFLLPILIAPLLRAAELTPGGVIEIEVPGLTNKIPVTLPKNYKPEQKHPLSVLIAASDKPETLRSAAGENRYVTAVLPILTGPDAPAKYGEIFDQIEKAIPNLAPGQSILGGHQAGADVVAALVRSDSAPVIERFYRFYVFDGGFGILDAPKLPGGKPDYPRRYLVVRSDGLSKGPTPAALDAFAARQDAAAPRTMILQSRAPRPEAERRILYFIHRWADGAKYAPVMVLTDPEELKVRYEARTFTDSRGVTIPYRLFVPKNQQPGQKYPLVLYVHDGGAQGDNNWVQLVGTGPGVFSDPIHQAKHPAYVLAPQYPRGARIGFGPPDTKFVDLTLELLRSVEKEFPNVDPDRIYVTGMSFGGVATWHFISNHRDLFAAAAPIAAAGNLEAVPSLKDFPIWAFHGTEDKSVRMRGPQGRFLDPLVGNADLIEALQKLGGPAKITIYEGEGHSIWTNAFNEPGFLDWLFAQRRKAR